MTAQIPYLKWGDYKSTDEKNPNVLEWKVTDTETFETEFSVNVPANINGVDVIIPLHNYGSNNPILITLWSDAVKSGRIKEGKTFKLYTWLAKSKRNPDRKIRRFKLSF